MNRDNQLFVMGIGFMMLAFIGLMWIVCQCAG